MHIRHELRRRWFRIGPQCGGRWLRAIALAGLVGTTAAARVASEPISPGGDDADFSGRWMLTSGNLQAPLTLKQSGSKLTGKYGWSEEFSLEGKVKGRSLSFSNSEGGPKGEGSAELWEDGRCFTGGLSLEGQKHFFGAYRRETKVAEARPGETTEGQSEAGLIYYLRVPKDWDGQRRYPMVIITHGSNANSKDYVATFPASWPTLAEDHVLVGVNGEGLSSGSKPGAVGHNASYINFSGPGKGPAFAQHQTPALLAETVKELKARLPVDRVYVGGHSQGGFLTYATFLYYPELFDGAFPMSCNLLVQCEPTWFGKDAIEKQRRIAVAPIHGRADTTVPFSSGQYAEQRMEELAIPRLHFFAPEQQGHAFMFLPVEPAIRWLDAMTSTDPGALLDFAEQQLAAREWRDASAAAQRARSLDKAGTLAARADAVELAVDAAAAPEAARLVTAIAKTKDNSWVDDFWTFRRQFGCTPGAAKCLAAYDKLRDKHTKPADELWEAARNASGEAERKSKQREIAEKYYASSWWILVKDSLK